MPALRVDLTAATATLAHADLLDLGVELFPYEPFAQRIRRLRATVTPDDGWYVALAEHLDAPMATADLAAHPAPVCVPEATAARRRGRGRGRLERRTVGD